MANAATELAQLEEQPRTADCWEGLFDTVVECDKPVTDITALDASGLIDTLKAIKAGEIDLNHALNGAAT